MSESLFRPALEFALRASLEHLENLAAAPVGATASLEQLRSGLCRPLGDGPLPAKEV